MAYGKVKADAFVYDNSGTDVEVSFSSLASKAPLASPNFTGIPLAPTANAGTNTTQIATTAFVTAGLNLKADLAGPTFTGVPAAPTASVGTNTTQIATTAFVTAAIDPNTAKTDVSQTFGPAQIFTAASVHNGGLDSNGSVDVAGSINIDGPYRQVAEALSTTTIDLSTGNYFYKTITANATFVFSNPPASGTVGSFTLELTHTGGTVTWPSSVKFNSDTAPTLTTGKTHLFFFVTDDGGTRYRGAALVDYVN